MSKLEKLTHDQIELMEVVKKEWISLLNSCRRPNREAITRGIKWLYNFCKLKEPLVIILQSPLGAQMAANILSNKKAQVGDQVGDQVGAQVRDQVGAQVWAQVGAQVWAQVGAQVWAQVGDQVWDQVWAQVKAQVWDQVGAQVRDQVWDQVRDQVRDQVWDQVGAQVRDQVRAQVGAQEEEYFYFATYGSVSDFTWLSFYDFFERIGIKHQVEAFASFRTLMQSGVYDMIQLDGVCIAVEMPVEIHRDTRGRLHNLEKAAIRFGDGYEMHSISGVRFSEDLFLDVSSNKLSAKDILKIQNIEQRMVALKLRGAENLISELNGKLLHHSDRGNELYLIKDVFSVPAYFLKYKCPSTDRIYVSGIDPEIGINGNADQCMAWKFGLEASEYDQMRIES